MDYFDYRTAARAAGISDELLASWRHGFECEYGDDSTMVELRLLRACNAVLMDGQDIEHVTEALAEEFGHVNA